MRGILRFAMRSSNSGMSSKTPGSRYPGYRPERRALGEGLRLARDARPIGDRFDADLISGVSTKASVPDAVVALDQNHREQNLLEVFGKTQISLDFGY